MVCTNWEFLGLKFDLEMKQGSSKELQFETKCPIWAFLSSPIHGKKYPSDVRYWNVLVLDSTRTCLVYQYCPILHSLYPGTMMTFFNHAMLSTNDNWFQTNPPKHESDDWAGFPMVKIWHVSLINICHCIVLSYNQNSWHDQDILVLVRVLDFRFPKFTDNFGTVFFVYTFDSSSKFLYPTGEKWHVLMFHCTSVFTWSRNEQFYRSFKEHVWIQNGVAPWQKIRDHVQNYIRGDNVGKTNCNKTVFALPWPGHIHQIQSFKKRFTYTLYRRWNSKTMYLCSKLVHLEGPGQRAKRPHGLAPSSPVVLLEGL